MSRRGLLIKGFRLANALCYSTDGVTESTGPLDLPPHWIPFYVERQDQSVIVWCYKNGSS